MSKSGGANGFDRCLPCNAMGALNQLCSSQVSWWPDLLSNWAPSGSSGKLRIAIRKRTINFYAKGQSVARITFGQGGKHPTMYIHEKYVKRAPSGEQKYIKLMKEEGRDQDGGSVTWGGSEMLKEWIRKSRRHVSSEKCCIDTLVGHSPKVIDLEMGLPAFGGRKSPLQMDLVSLESTSDDICLVFWEGKMISDSRLRSSNGEPKVFDQIDAYHSYLADPDRAKEVAKAYIACCKIICDLHGMAKHVGMTHPIDPLIEMAAEASSLTVEKTPRLVVFDNYRKRRESAWQEHLKVLRSRVSVAIVDKQSEGMPLESIPRLGG